MVTLAIPAGLSTTAGQNISMLHAEAVHGPPPAPVFHHYPPPIREIATYITNGDGGAVSYTVQFTYMYVQAGDPMSLASGMQLRVGLPLLVRRGPCC